MADLFRSQVRFYGKHGQYLEALTPAAEKAKDVELPEIERVKYLFNSVVEIYEVAPLIGYLYQRSPEKDGNEATKNIMEGALSKHHDRLLFSYEMLMILDNNKGSAPDLNERIRRAFRASDDLAAEGMKVFDAYARGGIEVLYENLIDNAATPDDLIRNLMDFTENWNSRFLSAVEEVDLDCLLKR